MAERTYSILIVDDIADWRETIKGLLEDEGYIVEVAGSTMEAVEKLKKMSFDLAMVDIRLDETDEWNIEGLDTLAQIIKNDYPHIKTIVLTGYATQRTLEQAMKPDASGERLVDYFMEKTETEELVKEVNELLIG